MRSSVALVAVLAGCGGHGSTPPPPAACTPDGQEVAGTPIALEIVDLGFDGGLSPQTVLVTSDAQLRAELGDPLPSELPAIDFATDRVVLGASNPAVRFAVEEASGDLVVGEEQLCQGVPPNRVAYILRGVISDVLAVLDCPYTGPDPCLAP